MVLVLYRVSSEEKGVCLGSVAKTTHHPCPVFFVGWLEPTEAFTPLPPPPGQSGAGLEGDNRPVVAGGAAWYSNASSSHAKLLFFHYDIPECPLSYLAWRLPPLAGGVLR